MVNYLSRSVGILLAVLITVGLAISKAPVPTCNSPRVNLQDLPISIQETQSFNMNDFFSGYNLNLTIPNKPQFVFIRDKVKQLKELPKSQPGLRNYHFASENNGWGRVLLTLSVFGNDTILRWGFNTANDTIPDLSNQVTITSNSSYRCFDAAWFRDEGIALVDCVRNGSVVGLQNVFLYVNTTSKTLIGQVKNDMYVPFSNIYHRKIRLLTENGYHYLIRAYFAEHVDDHFDDNTYCEIMSVNNPMKPWTIRVMDRSFLHQDKLSIMDFQVYLGDIYLLDYHSGVIKFDITTAQTIVIVGRYRTDSGFTKLGVYSSNMVNEFLLVLAHDHAIFEIDWTNQIKPVLLTKYSIPEGAWIHDLWVNEQYVVTQLTANLSDSKNQTRAYQSTYVFTRGSRTYLNAYAAIPHPNFHAFVELNRDNSQIMTIDTDRIAVIQISTPTVSVMPVNPNLLGKEFNFIIKGESVNEYTNESLVCTFMFKYLVVDNDSLALYPTGLKLPQTYYANYPGQLYIPLDRIIFGSNITYGIYDIVDPYPPVHYILQQNDTLINWWNKNTSSFKYTFLRQQQYDHRDETEIYIYTQDAKNDTHFSRCITIPFTPQVHCVESGYAPHINFRIVNLTANFFHYYGGQYIHLAAILYDEFPNEVFIYDLTRNQELGAKPIMFPQGYEGKIQSIEFLGHYLVVVLRYVKQIVFFDMIQCWDHQERDCAEVYRIDSRMMDKIGVNYFSPIEVYTSDFHPFVLFIQCVDRVVILDITKTGPIKLAEIKSPATQEPGFYKWKMAIARGELILVNPPNRIEEHDLDEIYTLRDAPMTKVFPTFRYIIPDKFDLDFSDTGNMFYIQAIDPHLPNTTNTVLLVYRTGYPAVSSLYDVWNLYQRYDDILIDVTGSFSDYIAVAYGSILKMFRQYEVPILVLEDSFLDFTFNISYTNDPHNRYQYPARISVKTANYPEDIIVNNSKLNTSDYLGKQFNYEQKYTRVNQFDDSSWFNGSVLNYTLMKCDECNKKMKVVNHVNEERVLLGTHEMNDYAFSFDGGFIQQGQSIIKMRHNGSIQQFVTMPSVFDGEDCITIEHNWIYDYTLSACKNSNEVYLYTTVYTASKPFVNGPYYSSAQHVVSMHVMDELLAIVDVDERPWSFDREGGVLLYAMNHDPFEPEIFDEIDYINTDDLTAANDWPGGPCFIGNAHFSFTNITGTYRLVITELRNGFFVVDFKWSKGRKSVEIIKVQFIDLKEQMMRNHVPLPNAAFYTAIAINKEYYDTRFGYWQTEVIVVTSNFHTFQVNLHVDRTGTVVAHEIAKIYYRYGFYETNNYIKTFDGYFAVGQRLPTILEVFDWYSKTVLVVYDSYERWNINQTNEEQEKPAVRYFEGTNIPVSYLLGGHTFKKGRISFDWNFTFVRNSSDPFRRIGLLALHEQQARIRELSVNEKLIILTEQGIDSSQKAVLRARNDYHQLDIPFTLNIGSGSGSDLPGWAIALIVIGAIALAGLLGYVFFLKFIKAKRPNRQSEVTEKSLLEKEGDAEYEKESDSDQDEEEEQEQEEEQEEQGQSKEYEPPKIENGSTNPTTANTESINRQTISSVGQAEAAPEQGEPKAE